MKFLVDTVGSAAFVIAFSAAICLALFTGSQERARAVPDAGVSLGAVWATGEVTTALPARGELLFFDRHGKTRAKLLDGTWPVRLVVYPMQGYGVLLEVDEMGRSSMTPLEKP